MMLAKCKRYGREDAMKQHSLAVLGYIVATFVTQAASHFVLFTQHYAAVPWIKPDPVFAFGITSMIVQGAILSFVYSRSAFNSGRLFDAITLSWLFGAFLVSYIGLGEAAKYAVPDMASWIGVECASGAVQFTLAGILLALAHRGAARIAQAQ
jgi:hypothetical protein